MSAVPYLVKHFARADMNDEIAGDAKEEFAQMFVDAFNGRVGRVGGPHRL